MCFSPVSCVAFFILSMSTPGPIVFANDTIAATDFLNSKGLLGSSMNYTTCGMVMNCVRHTNIVPARMHGVGGVLVMLHIAKSITTGTFFSKLKLSIQKWTHLIHLWSISMPVTIACKEADVASKIAIDRYQWLREVCSTRLLTTPIKLGGPGTIIQADELLFNHKPKVK